MTTLFAEDFTGTNGAAWDTGKWSTTGLEASGVVDIQSNAGHMQATGGAYKAARARANMTAVADCEVLLSVTLGATTEQYVLAHLRASDTYSANYPVASDSYRVQVAVFHGQIDLVRNIAGTDLNLNSATGLTFSAAKYWLRFQCIGTTLRYKFWLASGSEPGAWDVSLTDATFASGKLALGLTCGAGTDNTVTWDDVVVSDNSTPPLELGHGQSYDRALRGPTASKRRLTAAQYQQRVRREVPPDNYTGALAETLDDLTSTAAGGAGASGTVAATLGTLTSAVTGASGAAGTLTQTLADTTLAASGSTGATGTLAETFDDTTSAAAGTFTDATPPVVDVPTLRPSMPMPRTGGTGRNVRLHLTARLGTVTAHTALRVEFADEELIEIL